MLNYCNQLRYKIAPDFTDIPFLGQCYMDFPLFAMNDVFVKHHGSNII